MKMSRDMRIGKEPIDSRPQLVRTALELEQFECIKCGRMVYINGMDLEAIRHEKGKIIIPDCPFECWGETKHRRTLVTEVKRVIDLTGE
jgi:hypothetical protein